jgi:hypothetical protein
MKYKSVILVLTSISLSSIVTFLVTKTILKKKYEILADNEVESVRNVYKKHFDSKEKVSDQDSDDSNDNKTNKDEEQNNHHDQEKPKNKSTPFIDYSAQYRDKVKPYDSTDHSEKNEHPKSDDYKNNNKDIYLITPEEFNNSPYPAKTLFYYKDSILADEDGNIVKDIPGTIGNDALNNFGIYETDCVYVRNEIQKVDYEVLIENHTYLEVKPDRGNSPSDDKPDDEDDSNDDNDE